MTCRLTGSLRTLQSFHIKNEKTKKKDQKRSGRRERLGRTVDFSSGPLDDRGAAEAASLLFSMGASLDRISFWAFLGVPLVWVLSTASSLAAWWTSWSSWPCAWSSQMEEFFRSLAGHKKDAEKVCKFLCAS